MLNVTKSKQAVGSDLGCPCGGLVKGDVQATRVLLVTCHLQVL